MKASYHNGRVGNTHHNDRTFNLDKAPHIDQSLTPKNRYFCTFPGETFTNAEKKFYKLNFQDWLKQRNEAAVKHRHPERKKTSENLRKEKRTRPEETILQIGDRYNFPDDDGVTLMACYKEFDEYRRKYIGRHCKTLNVALHLDEPEGTPHIHERHVWMFVDEKDKIVKIGQEEALKHAGIELPFPDRPQSRTNNRKMTFDAVMREKWYDIVDDYYLKKGGLENQATNFNKDANKMIKERLNNATVTEKDGEKIFSYKREVSFTESDGYKCQLKNVQF